VAFQIVKRTGFGDEEVLAHGAKLGNGVPACQIAGWLEYAGLYLVGNTPSMVFFRGLKIFSLFTLNFKVLLDIFDP
jgi:hypothetical protein